MKDELFRFGLRGAVLSDRGLNPDRPVNEDAGGIRVVGDDPKRPVVLAFVADGMGGMDHGELASAAAGDEFLRIDPPVSVLNGPSEFASWVVDRVDAANSAVMHALEGANGGCTFIGLAYFSGYIAIGHVGDSRAYLFGNGQLQPISNDHSLVAALVKAGQLTEEEAAVSPDRNAILKSLGQHSPLPAGYVDDLRAATGNLEFKLPEGFGVLLCSDGVWGEVPHEAIQQITSQNSGNPDGMVSALINAAHANGAPDNCTAVVLERVNTKTKVLNEPINMPDTFEPLPPTRVAPTGQPVGVGHQTLWGDDVAAALAAATGRVPVPAGVSPAQFAPTMLPPVPPSSVPPAMVPPGLYPPTNPTHVQGQPTQAGSASPRPLSSRRPQQTQVPPSAVGDPPGRPNNTRILALVGVIIGCVVVAIAALALFSRPSSPPPDTWINAAASTTAVSDRLDTLPKTPTTTEAAATDKVDEVATRSSETGTNGKAGTVPDCRSAFTARSFPDDTFKGLVDRITLQCSDSPIVAIDCNGTVTTVSNDSVELSCAPVEPYKLRTDYFGNGVRIIVTGTNGEDYLTRYHPRQSNLSAFKFDVQWPYKSARPTVTPRTVPTTTTKVLPSTTTKPTVTTKPAPSSKLAGTPSAKGKLATEAKPEAKTEADSSAGADTTPPRANSSTTTSKPEPLDGGQRPTGTVDPLITTSPHASTSTVAMTLS